MVRLLVLTLVALVAGTALASSPLKNITKVKAVTEKVVTIPSATAVEDPLASSTMTVAPLLERSRALSNSEAVVNATKELANAATEPAVAMARDSLMGAMGDMVRARESFVESNADKLEAQVEAGLAKAEAQAEYDDDCVAFNVTLKRHLKAIDICKRLRAHAGGNAARTDTAVASYLEELATLTEQPVDHSELSGLVEQMMAFVKPKVNATRTKLNACTRAYRKSVAAADAKVNNATAKIAASKMTFFARYEDMMQILLVKNSSSARYDQMMHSLKANSSAGDLIVMPVVLKKQKAAQSKAAQSVSKFGSVKQLYGEHCVPHNANHSCDYLAGELAKHSSMNISAVAQVAVLEEVKQTLNGVDTFELRLAVVDAFRKQALADQKTLLSVGGMPRKLLKALSKAKILTQIQSSLGLIPKFTNWTNPQVDTTPFVSSSLTLPVTIEVCYSALVEGADKYTACTSKMRAEQQNMQSQRTVATIAATQRDLDMSCANNDSPKQRLGTEELLLYTVDVHRQYTLETNRAAKKATGAKMDEAPKTCEMKAPVVTHLKPAEGKCQPSLYVGKNIMYNRLHYLVVKTGTGKVAKRMYPSAAAYGCCAMPVTVIVSKACFASIPFALPLVTITEDVCTVKAPEAKTSENSTEDSNTTVPVSTEESESEESDSNSNTTAKADSVSEGTTENSTAVNASTANETSANKTFANETNTDEYGIVSTNSTSNSSKFNASAFSTAPGSSSATASASHAAEGTGAALCEQAAFTGQMLCSKHATCSQSTEDASKIECNCNTGFEGTGKKCTASKAFAPECVNSRGKGRTCHASAACVQKLTGNLNGSSFDIMCVCNTHFKASGPQGSDCVVINECTSNVAKCNADAACAMAGPGNVSCTCNAGFSGNGQQCVEANPCSSNVTNDCAANALCVSTGANTTTAHVCKCRAGYTGDAHVACTAINACTEGAAVGYNPCNPTRKAVAKDKFEAERACKSEGVNTFSCSCSSNHDDMGYKCAPKNPCLEATWFSLNAKCTVVGPNQASVTCNRGFSGDGKTCEAIPACQISPPRSREGKVLAECPVNSVCNTTRVGEVATYGSWPAFTCHCHKGYVAVHEDDVMHCVEVNPCESNNGECSNDATCTHTAPGNRTCLCTPGFSGDGETCTAIDNCKAKTSNCDDHAICTSTGPGKSTCACKNFYSGDGKDCAAVDQCLAPLVCHKQATCTQKAPLEGPSRGGVSCACNSGYSGDGKKACVQMNPCSVSADDCDANAMCTSTGLGRHSCACVAGYSGNGTVCVEINKCQDKSLTCGDNSFCRHVGPANDVCDCDDNYEVFKACDSTKPSESACGTLAPRCGWQQDETKRGGRCVSTGGEVSIPKGCSPMNACALDNGGCSHKCNSTGANQRECTCPEGFSMGAAGLTCSPIDMCMQPGVCAKNADCTSASPGQFSCACKDGYEGDGNTTCTGVDPCEAVNACASFGSLEATICYGPGVSNTTANRKSTLKAGQKECGCNPSPAHGYVQDDTSGKCREKVATDFSASACGTKGSTIVKKAMGNFVCVCPENFRASTSGACEPINYCVEPDMPNGGCSSDAACSSNGTVTCKCNTGFKGDGIACSATASNCTAGQRASCSSDAMCAVKFNSSNVTCVCKDGYMGNGKKCSEIKACKTVTSKVTSPYSFSNMNKAHMLDAHVFSTKAGLSEVFTISTQGFQNFVKHYITLFDADLKQSYNISFTCKGYAAISSKQNVLQEVSGKPLFNCSGETAVWVNVTSKYVMSTKADVNTISFGVGHNSSTKVLSVVDTTIGGQPIITRMSIRSKVIESPLKGNPPLNFFQKLSGFNLTQGERFAVVVDTSASMLTADRWQQVRAAVASMAPALAKTSAQGFDLYKYSGATAQAVLKIKSASSVNAALEGTSLGGVAHTGAMLGHVVKSASAKHILVITDSATTDEDKLATVMSGLTGITVSILQVGKDDQCKAMLARLPTGANIDYLDYLKSAEKAGGFSSVVSGSVSFLETSPIKATWGRYNTVHNGGCDAQAVCTSAGPGRAACKCKPGYQGDGVLCEVFNPCHEIKRGGCHSQATCSMTQPGNSSCSCNFGYEGTGKQCTLKDVCATGTTSSYQIDSMSNSKFTVATSSKSSINEVFDISRSRYGFGHPTASIKINVNNAFAYEFSLNNISPSTLAFRPCLKCSAVTVWSATTIGLLKSTKAGPLYLPDTIQNTMWVRQAGSLISMGKGAVVGKQAIFYYDMNQDSVAAHLLANVNGEESRDMLVSGYNTIKSHKFGCGGNTDCTMKGFDTPMQTTCVCKDGYRLQTQGTKSACMAINHCKFSGSCASFGSAATCSFTGAGTFDCLCPSGFQKDITNTSCVEVSPCNTNNGGCDRNSTCMKTAPGKNKCVCKTGFSSVAGQPCAPVDPCAANNGGCDPHAACNNTKAGERTCDCNDGYSGNGVYCEFVQEESNVTSINTSAVNPCNTSNAQLRHTCDSKFGKCTQRSSARGYSCGCKAGYRCESDACTSCVGIDKCLNPSNGGCGMHAKCTQFDVSAPVVCKCATGYEHVTKNSSCTSINPCAKSPCAAKQTCQQTGAGKHACACSDGFEMTKGSCTPIDYCKGNVCDSNARCVARPDSLSYQCFCTADFQGDGFECTKKLVITSTGDDIPDDGEEKECEAGQYADYDGTVKVCTACPANTYNSIRDALSCTGCNTGFTSDVGSKSKGDCYLECPNCGEFDSGSLDSEEHELDILPNETTVSSNTSVAGPSEQVKLVDINADISCYSEEAEAYSAAVFHLTAVEIQVLANVSSKSSVAEAKAEVAKTKGDLRLKKFACATASKNATVNETSDESLPSKNATDEVQVEKVDVPVATEVEEKVVDPPQAGSDTYTPDATNCDVDNGGCSPFAVCTLGVNSSNPVVSAVTCTCGVGYNGNGVNCTQIGGIEAVLANMTSNETADDVMQGRNTSIKDIFMRMAGHVEENQMDDSGPMHEKPGPLRDNNEPAVRNATNATSDEDEPTQTDTTLYTMDITLLKAKDVLDADTNGGHSDPYAMVKTGSEWCISEKKRNNANPVWNKVCRMYETKTVEQWRNYEFSFSVMDHDSWGVVNHDDLGSPSTLACSTLSATQSCEQTLSLKKGVLRVKYMLVATAIQLSTNISFDEEANASIPVSNTSHRIGANATQKRTNGTKHAVAKKNTTDAKATVTVNLGIAYVGANRKQFIEAFCSDVASSVGCKVEQVHVTNISPSAGSVVVTFKIDGVTDPAANVTDEDGSSKITKSGMNQLNQLGSNALSGLNGKVVEVSAAKKVKVASVKASIDSENTASNETASNETASNETDTDTDSEFTDGLISGLVPVTEPLIVIGEPLIIIGDWWSMDQADEADEDQKTINDDAETCTAQGIDCGSDDDGEDSKAIMTVLKLEKKNQKLMKEVFTYLNSHKEFQIIVQIFSNSFEEFIKQNATALA